MDTSSNFILSHLHSNKFLLVLLFLIPFIISLAFGNILYNDNNLGKTYYKTVGLSDINELYEDNEGESVNESDSFLDAIYEKYFNTSNVQPRLKRLQDVRFSSSFFGALIETSKISMILGGIIAILTGGKMVNDRSIIYLIVNKKGRLRAFLEFFLYPLPFLFLVIFLSSLSVTTIVAKSYLEISMTKVLGLSLFTLSMSALQGYILASFFALLVRNNSVSLLGVFGVVLALPVFPEGRQIILLFTYIGNKIFYDIPIPETNYLYLGGLILVSLPFINYLLFKRGDFYRS